MKSMSQYVMMGENYVSTLFKKKTGQTLIHYLHRVRVNQAIQYLCHSDLPVYEIGNRVGFVNDNYFIKIFKRLTAQTPSQYRQNNRSKPEPVTI
ncbi:Bifunctional transcriptional activator/DNA repair enzyme AdaA [compost metagenome]